MINSVSISSDDNNDDFKQSKKLIMDNSASYSKSVVKKVVLDIKTLQQSGLDRKIAEALNRQKAAAKATLTTYENVNAERSNKPNSKGTTSNVIITNISSVNTAAATTPSMETIATTSIGKATATAVASASSSTSTSTSTSTSSSNNAISNRKTANVDLNAPKNIRTITPPTITITKAMDSPPDGLGLGDAPSSSSMSANRTRLDLMSSKDRLEHAKQLLKRNILIRRQAALSNNQLSVPKAVILRPTMKGCEVTNAKSPPKILNFSQQIKSNKNSSPIIVKNSRGSGSKPKEDYQVTCGDFKRPFPKKNPVVQQQMNQPLASLTTTSLVQAEEKQKTIENAAAPIKLPETHSSSNLIVLENKVLTPDEKIDLLSDLRLNTTATTTTTTTQVVSPLPNKIILSADKLKRTPAELAALAKQIQSSISSNKGLTGSGIQKSLLKLKALKSGPKLPSQQSTKPIRPPAVHLLENTSSQVITNNSSLTPPPAPTPIHHDNTSNSSYNKNSSNDKQSVNPVSAQSDSYFVYSNQDLDGENPNMENFENVNYNASNQQWEKPNQVHITENNYSTVAAPSNTSNTNTETILSHNQNIDHDETNEIKEVSATRKEEIISKPILSAVDFIAALAASNSVNESMSMELSAEELSLHASFSSSANYLENTLTEEERQLMQVSSPTKVNDVASISEVKDVASAFKGIDVASTSNVNNVAAISEVKDVASSFKGIDVASTSNVNNFATISKVKDVASAFKGIDVASTSNVNNVAVISEVKDVASISNVKDVASTSNVNNVASISEEKDVASTSNVTDVASASAVNDVALISEVNNVAKTSEVNDISDISIGQILPLNNVNILDATIDETADNNILHIVSTLNMTDPIRETSDENILNDDASTSLIIPETQLPILTEIFIPNSHEKEAETKVEDKTKEVEVIEKTPEIVAPIRTASVGRFKKGKINLVQRKKPSAKKPPTIVEKIEQATETKNLSQEISEPLGTSIEITDKEKITDQNKETNHEIEKPLTYDQNIKGLDSNDLNPSNTKVIEEELSKRNVNDINEEGHQVVEDSSATIAYREPEKINVDTPTSTSLMAAINYVQPDHGSPQVPFKVTTSPKVAMEQIEKPIGIKNLLKIIEDNTIKQGTSSKEALEEGKSIEVEVKSDQEVKSVSKQEVKIDSNKERVPQAQPRKKLIKAKPVLKTKRPTNSLNKLPTKDDITKEEKKEVSIEAESISTNGINNCSSNANVTISDEHTNTQLSTLSNIVPSSSSLEEKHFHSFLTPERKQTGREIEDNDYELISSQLNEINQLPSVLNQGNHLNQEEKEIVEISPAEVDGDYSSSGLEYNVPTIRFKRRRLETEQESSELENENANQLAKYSCDDETAKDESSQDERCILADRKRLRKAYHNKTLKPVRETLSDDSDDDERFVGFDEQEKVWNQRRSIIKEKRGDSAKTKSTVHGIMDAPSTSSSGMPLKKRWEILKNPQNESEITDDTSPVEDENFDQMESIENSQTELEITDDKTPIEDEHSENLDFLENPQIEYEVTDTIYEQQQQPIEASTSNSIEQPEENVLETQVVKNKRDLSDYEIESQPAKRRRRKQSSDSSDDTTVFIDHVEEIPAEKGRQIENDEDEKSDNVNNQSTEEVPLVEKTVTPQPKRRGRPPKNAKLLPTPVREINNVDTIRPSEEPQQVSSLKPDPKKRGRKPKLLQTQSSEREINNADDSSMSMPAGESQMVASPKPEPKKRGRKPKQPKPEASDEDESNKQECKSTQENTGLHVEVPTFDPRLLLIQKREQLKSTEELTTPNEGTGPLQCGLCLTRITKNGWIAHLSKHYGIGWLVGETPLNVSSRSIILATSIAFFRKTGIKGLACRMCQRVYRSALGLLLHIETCGEEPQKADCTYCQKTYTKSSLPVHERACLQRITLATKESEVAQGSETESNGDTTQLSNSGRTKRVSTLKAESKLKKIGMALTQQDPEDIQPFDPKKFIQYKSFDKNISEFQKKWESELESFGSTFCPQTVCTFSTTDLSLMLKHLDECKYIPKTGYYCTACKKSTTVYISEAKALKHIKERHKPARNFDTDGSDYDIKDDEENSDNDDDDFSSGVDSNEDEPLTENTDDEEEGGSGNKKDKMHRKKTDTLQKPLLPFRQRGFNKVITQKWHKFLRENHTNDLLYSYALPEYTKLSSGEALKYLPMQETSMKFSYENTQDINKNFGSKMKVQPEWTQLKRFESINQKNEHFTFIGGAIRHLAWIPMPANNSSKDQYLALSYCKMQQFTRHSNPKLSPSIILIMKFTESKQSESKAWQLNSSVHYGIRIPEGPVHSFAMLPSGGYSEEKNRLGLIAVACAIPNIKIYSLPLKLSESETQETTYSCCLIVLDLNPCAILTLELHSQNENKLTHDLQCMQICWSESKGHNLIVAGFSNGCIGFWDIEENETENLNRFMINDLRYFVPLNYIYLNDKNIRYLALHYGEDGPRWLAIGSSTRKFGVFNIRNFSAPQPIAAEMNTQVSSCVDWPPMWECATFGWCNIQSKRGSRVISFNPIGVGYNVSTVDFMLNTPRSVHYNCELLIPALGNDNGDIIVLNPREFNLESTIINSQRTHRAVSMLDLQCLSGDKTLSLQEQELSTPTSNNDEFNQRYGVIFKSFVKVPCPKKNLYLNENRRSPSNLLAFLRVNSVRFNGNASATNWLAAGCENGFLRIFNFKREIYFQTL